jgi:hypothetical protein
MSYSGTFYNGHMNEEKIREDFERRLDTVKEDFLRHRDNPVMQKLIELNDVCPIAVYALFEKLYTCGFESLERLENLLSFVGNFYDDSIYDVVWEVSEYMKNFPNATSYPYVIQVFDDAPKGLTEEKLCGVIQWYIDREIAYAQKVNELETRRKLKENM